MPDNQTVEDLGKMVKSKYPKTYDSLSDIEVGQKVKTKYPDAYGHFNDMPASAMSRFGTGLYNTTVGPVVKAAQDIPGAVSNLIGIPQFKEAYNQFKQGNYIPAAESFEKGLNLPQRMAEGAAEPIAQDVQQGNYAGALGQGVGLGASLFAPKALGILGDTKLGTAAGAGVKAAGPGVIKGGAMVGGGELLGKVPGMEWPARIGMGYPGARLIGQALQKGTQAFGDAWKGKVNHPEPPPIPKQTGVTPQQLKSSAVNGHITPQQFDAAIDARNDLTPEAKAFHKDDLRSSLMRVNPPSLGQPTKEISLGTAKDAVKAGEEDINWFKDKLKQQGHSDESIEKESNRLTREIEESKEAEKAKEAKSTSEPKKPKNQTKSPEVKVEAPKVEAPKSPELKVEAPKSLAPEIEPRHEPYYNPDNPIAKAPITQQGIEESQSIARAAKETTLSRHLIKNKIDLDSIPKTSEYLKAISKEAGLKRVASLRTLEGAIKRARELKVNPPSSPKE